MILSAYITLKRILVTLIEGPYAQIGFTLDMFEYTVLH